MSTLGVRVFRAVLAANFVVLFSSSAYAYLDPGTGSMILQVLLGGVAGLALAGKLYWHKFISLFGTKTNAEAELAESEPTEPRR
jgi:hypothetical protein